MDNTSKMNRSLLLDVIDNTAQIEMSTGSRDVRITYRQDYGAGKETAVISGFHRDSDIHWATDIDFGNYVNSLDREANAKRILIMVVTKASAQIARRMIERGTIRTGGCNCCDD